MKRTLLIMTFALTGEMAASSEATGRQPLADDVLSVGSIMSLGRQLDAIKAKAKDLGPEERARLRAASGGGEPQSDLALIEILEAPATAPGQVAH